MRALKHESTLHRDQHLMTTNPVVFYHTWADFLTGIKGSRKSFQSQSAIGLLGSVVWHLHRGLDIKKKTILSFTINLHFSVKSMC